MDVEAAKAAHAASDRDYIEWDTETERLAREAAYAVRSARRDEATRLSRIRQEAFVAMRDAENAAVTPHEWNGKRVVFREEIRNRWSSMPTGKFRDPIYGVVETYKHGAALPENVSWRLSRMQPGTPFIRLLKKDGTVGLKVAEFESKWKLDQ